MKWNQAGAFLKSNHKKFNFVFVGIFLFVNLSSIGFGQTTTTTIPAPGASTSNQGIPAINGLDSCKGSVAVQGQTTTASDPSCITDQKCADKKNATSQCLELCSDKGGAEWVACMRNLTPIVDGTPISCLSLNDSEDPKCGGGRAQCAEAAKEYTTKAGKCTTQCEKNGEACSQVSSTGKASAASVNKCPASAKSQQDDNKTQRDQYEERMKEDREKLATAQENQSKDQEASQAQLDGLSSQIKSATGQSQQIQLQLTTELQSLKESTDSATSAAQASATQLTNSITDLRTAQAAQAKNKAAQAAQAVLDKCWTDADKSTTDYFNEIARGNTQFSGNPTAFSVSQQISLAASGNRTSQKAAIRAIYYAQCLATGPAKNAMATAQENLQTDITTLNSKITQVKQNLVDVQTNLGKVIQNATNRGNLASAKAAAATLKLSQDLQTANDQLQQKTAMAAQQAARDKQNVDQLTAEEKEDEDNFNKYDALYKESNKNNFTSDQAKKSTSDLEAYTDMTGARKSMEEECCSDGVSRYPSVVRDTQCAKATAANKKADSAK